MVIGRTPLTEELYGNFVIGEYEKVYAVNIRNRFRSAATHLIVANYRKSWDYLSESKFSYKYNEPEIRNLRLFDPEQPYGENR